LKEGVQVKLKWLGHASFRIKTGSHTLYLDPFAGEYDEPADLILSTHDHYDHNQVDKVSRKPGCQVFQGPTNEDLGWVKVKSVPAYNVGKEFHPKGTGVGYLITAEGKTIYHAGDTDVIPEMKDLKGKVDVALLPVGGKYTMNLEEAGKAVEVIQPKKVVPMHYNSISGVASYRPEEINLKNALVLKQGQEIDL
jgi:L-ascorbate metabolism protein UlaG (beta-lactamase superfamily)